MLPGLPLIAALMIDALLRNESHTVFTLLDRRYAEHFTRWGVPPYLGDTNGVVVGLGYDETPASRGPEGLASPGEPVDRSQLGRQRWPAGFVPPPRHPGRRCSNSGPRSRRG